MIFFFLSMLFAVALRGAPLSEKTPLDAARSVALLLGLGLLLVGTGSPAHGQVPQESIHPGKTGQELINALKSDYAPNQTLGYDVARDSLYRHLDTRDGVLIGRYGGYTVDIGPNEDPSSAAYENGAGISAEHTWPQSKGAGNEPQKSDMHHLFPVKQTINSARSNDPYSEAPDSDTDTWYRLDQTQSSTPTSSIDDYSEDDGAFPSDANYSNRFEPRENHEGNAARAAFYYYVIYNNTISDLDFFSAQKEDLIEWHNRDEVDQNEYDLGQWIKKKQGTANPFVLDTTLVRRAFETTSSVPTVQFTASSQSAAEGDGTATLTAELNNPDGNAVDVDVAFKSGSSSALTDDIGNYGTTTLSFGAGASNGATKSVDVVLTDDSQSETTETAVFALENLSTSGSATVGSPSTTELSISDNDEGGTSRLLISQYVDTDSGTEPKGIEIQNVSGGEIDFSATGLTVNRYANGSTSPDTEFTLSSGTLANGDILVIGGSTLKSYMSNNASSVDFYNDGFSHNGNDALEVLLGGETEDVFGQIGTDPGTAWKGNGVSTADQNIQLLSGITSGKPAGFSDPSTRFETVSTSPSNGGLDLSGFGDAPASVCTEPSAQPTSLSLSSQSSSQIDGSYTGSGADGYLVARSTSSSLSAAPSDGTTYSAGDALGSGTVVTGSGGTSFSESGLSGGTTYYFFVFAVNDEGCTNPDYLTSSSLSGSEPTPEATTVTVFDEDFEDEASGDTAPGDGSWSIDVSGATLESGDHFEVKNRSTNVFEGQDLDGPTTWTTASLDISSYSGGNVSLDVIEDGDHESADYVDVAYSLDGGAYQTVKDYNGLGSSSHTLVGDKPDDADWGSETVEVTGLSGSTLQLRVRMDNNAASENLRIDNVTVTGEGLSDPVVQFQTASVSASEGGGSAGLTVELLSPDGSAVDVDVAYDGSSSSASSSDIGSFSSETVSFSASAENEATKTVSVPLTDDSESESTETAVFALQNLSTSGDAKIGSADEASLQITDNEASSGVLITEIMPDPNDVSDSDGEWVEVYNTTDSPIDLNGWILKDADSDSHVLSSSVVVPAGGRSVLCSNASEASNGGFSCDYEWSGTAMANSGDEVILLDGGGAEIDRVAYTSSWPYSSGTAMTFTGSVAADNNDSANWTSAPARGPSYDIAGGSDLGTPSAPDAKNALPVSATIDGSAGWRMLATPVSGATAGDLSAQNLVQGITGSHPGADPNLYVSYDAPGSQTSSEYWTPAQDVSTALSAGRGFIWYLFDNDTAGSKPLPFTLDYSRPILTGDVSVSLSKEEEWHLIGNPYPTSFDLSGLDLSAQGFQTTVQVYDSPTNSYQTISQESGSGDLIAAHQGFFVQRSSTGSGTASLTFAANRRSGGASTFYKSSPRSSSTKRSRSGHLHLKLTGLSSDGDTLTVDKQTEVHVREGASTGWDRWDATKLQPLSAPYATIAAVGRREGESENQVHLSLPEALETETDVPLHLVRSGTDEVDRYVIEWPEVKIPDGWSAKLVDRDGKTIDLSEGKKRYVIDAGSLPEQNTGVSKAQALGSEMRGAGANSGAELQNPLHPNYQSNRKAGARKAGATNVEPAQAKAQTDSARFRLQIQPNGGPLPVELSGMRVRADGQRAVLSWTTASEQNNAGFHVERQRLAVEDTTVTPAEADWKQVAFIEGSGTTNDPQSYRYETEALDFGRHTFRLRQIDTDGTETTTDPVEATVRLRKAYAVGALYPNPVQTQATLPITVRDQQPVTVELYDVLGRRVRTVLQRELPPQETVQIRLKTRSLASGSYFVRIRGENFTATERLTIVR